MFLQLILRQSYLRNVEGTSKKDDSMLTGYTRHQKLVNFKGDPKDIGKIIKVKITEAKTWALKGESIES